MALILDVCSSRGVQGFRRRLGVRPKCRSPFTRISKFDPFESVRCSIGALRLLSWTVWSPSSFTNVRLDLSSYTWTGHLSTLVITHAGICQNTKHAENVGVGDRDDHPVRYIFQSLCISRQGTQLEVLVARIGDLRFTHIPPGTFDCFTFTSSKPAFDAPFTLTTYLFPATILTLTPSDVGWIFYTAPWLG